METARDAIAELFELAQARGEAGLGATAIFTFRLLDVPQSVVASLAAQVAAQGYAVQTIENPSKPTFNTLLASQPLEKRAEPVAECYEYFERLAASNPPCRVGAIEFPGHSIAA